MSAQIKIELTGQKILVIDDDVTTRRLVRRVLETKGIVVDEAGSGLEGLEMIPEFQPDLVLLDIVMPGLDGYETCREIKKLPGCVDLPVIFLTAKADTTAVVKALSDGGSDYITKPFRAGEALARIKVHLELRTLMGIHKDYIKALRKANQAKSKLMGVVSHDLKNPLVSIRGLAEFLGDGVAGPMNSDQVSIIQSIFSASDNMLALVDDLIDYAVTDHREDRKESTPTTPNDLEEVVRSAVTLFRFNAAQKEIKIQLKDQGRLPNIPFDQRQIRRVIDNLLSNAIKFSPPQRSVEINLHNGGNTLRCEVADEGPGIPEDEVPNIFLEFGTTSVKPTGGEMSTGLGLSICKKIVESHGGEISFRNRPEGGCLFAFTLPLQAPVEDEILASC